jgi:hypothetical protein
MYTKRVFGAVLVAKSVVAERMSNCHKIPPEGQISIEIRTENSTELVNSNFVFLPACLLMDALSFNH